MLDDDDGHSASIKKRLHVEKQFSDDIGQVKESKENNHKFYVDVLKNENNFVENYDAVTCTTPTPPFCKFFPFFCFSCVAQLICFCFSNFGNSF